MASPPTYSTADFLAGMQGLLPTGPAWPRDADAVQTRAFGALAPTYAENAGSAAGLLADAFPSTVGGLLPEWEATLGLPDPCTPLNPSVAQRRAAVLAKFIAFGGQSTAYYESVAAALGYPITITELTADGYAWQINAPTVNISFFTAGFSVAGDPLWSTGNSELECRIRQIMPAHTVLTFNYFPGAGLTNNGGVLQVTNQAGWPTSATGLPAGAVWDAGGAVYVVPGVTPNPAAPPVMFGSIVSTALLVLGGGNLPLTDPVNTLQIWNNAGILCVSLG